MDKEEVERALARLYWGKKGESKGFSMGKLVLAIAKKRLSGRRKVE